MSVVTWRMRLLSRWALTTPPSHRRVGTATAMASQSTPCCTLARISSACTCPRSRGCTTCSWWTCSQCRPAASTHPRTVRPCSPPRGLDRGHRAAMRYQRHHQCHHLLRCAPPIEEGPRPGTKRAPADLTAIPLLLQTMDRDVPFARLSSCWAVLLGAECLRWVHGLSLPSRTAMFTREILADSFLSVTSSWSHHGLAHTYRHPIVAQKCEQLGPVL